MSRIGKLPINIPQNVNVNYIGSKLTVEGKYGSLAIEIPKETFKIIQEKDQLKIELKSTGKKAKSLHGLYRTLVFNMIFGVAEAFIITLILKGVGYRASVKGNELILSLGYSHLVTIAIPKEINVEIIQNTTINLKSCDKEKVGSFASNIRSWRLPEPYKGKGILYKDEHIIRKAGKTGK